MSNLSAHCNLFFLLNPLFKLPESLNFIGFHRRVFSSMFTKNNHQYKLCTEIGKPLLPSNRTSVPPDF